MWGREFFTIIWSENLRGTGHLLRPRRKWEEHFKMNSNKM